MSIENTTLSEFENDTSRLYNTTGLLQDYQLTSTVWVSGGYEKGVLIDGNLTQEQDAFNAYRAGVSYRTETLSAVLNGEYRDGTMMNKRNILVGIYTQANQSLGLAYSSSYHDEYNTLDRTSRLVTRLSLAYRPGNPKWIILNRLEHIDEDEIQDRNLSLSTTKVINNLNVNYTPFDEFEISLQHGFKYAVNTIDDYSFTGIAQLFGIDTRYDITPKIDIGMQASVLSAQSANNLDYGTGAYVGYNVASTMWLSLGYNVRGFRENDFSLQTYRAQGPYIRFMMRLDQQSLKEMARGLSW